MAKKKKNKNKYLEDDINEKRLVEKRGAFIEWYRKRGKPIWTDENHPDLNTPEDFANYRRTLWGYN